MEQQNNFKKIFEESRMQEGLQAAAPIPAGTA